MKPEDVIDIPTAARLLGYAGLKPESGVGQLIRNGRLKTYSADGTELPYTPYYRVRTRERRFVARAEVEALRERRLTETQRRADAAVKALEALSG